MAFTISNKVDSFESYLTRIDPRTVNNENLVYIINEDFDTFSIVRAYPEILKLRRYYRSHYEDEDEDENISWKMREDGINVISSNDDKIYYVYAMIGDPNSKNKILHHDIKINSIYVNGSPEILMSIHLSPILDVKIGDIIIDDWNDLHTVRKIKRSGNVITVYSGIVTDTFITHSMQYAIAYNVSIMKLTPLGG